MGQAGPPAASAGRVVVVTEAKVAMTGATTMRRVIASLCFTRFSLSAVRRSSSATDPRALAVRRGTQLFPPCASALPALRDNGVAVVPTRCRPYVVGGTSTQESTIYARDSQI